MSADVTSNPHPLDSFWMPFSNNRQFRQQPKLIQRADGMYFYSCDGQPLLDGSAGLWCVNAGHGRHEIREAINNSLQQLDYCHCFNLGHPVAFELAEQLQQHFPAPYEKVFFTNSGSEAVDTALKMALAYHQLQGHGERHRLVGRERAYHGVGFGGISVGGLVANRERFGPLLPGALHLPHTLLESNRFALGQPPHGLELADTLRQLVQLHGANSIAAVIVEPVAGAGGVLPPPLGYLERLRSLCDEYGILLIFDEVITAFGRLGFSSAAERWGIEPDLITCAKGLTNGCVPMGAVLAHKRIAEVFEQQPAGVELYHGYTYSGHPLACAAASACLQLYQREGLYQRVQQLENEWQQSALLLKGAPHVVDIRTIGLLAAIQLAPLGGNSLARPKAVFEHCFAHGVLVRNVGDSIALSPPLIISKTQIAQLFNAIGDALQQIN